MKTYWQAKEEDCSVKDPKVGEVYEIFGLKNMVGDKWVKVFGFYDSDKEGFVFIKPGSQVEIQGKIFDVVHGHPFVLKEDEDKVFDTPSVIHFDDSGLLSASKRRITLRTFEGKKVKVIRLLD